MLIWIFWDHGDNIINIIIIIIITIIITIIMTIIIEITTFRLQLTSFSHAMIFFKLTD